MGIFRKGGTRMEQMTLFDFVEDDAMDNSASKLDVVKAEFIQTPIFDTQNAANPVYIPVCGDIIFTRRA